MDTIYEPGSPPKSLATNTDGTYTLKELQELVNGKIDLLYLPTDKKYMIYNERSKEKIFPYNAQATQKIKESYPNIPIGIYGVAILTDKIN